MTLFIHGMILLIQTTSMSQIAKKQNLQKRFPLLRLQIIFCVYNVGIKL